MKRIIFHDGLECRFRKRAGELISNGLAVLLEEKHLYQSVNIPISDAVDAIRDRITEDPIKHNHKNWIRESEEVEWETINSNPGVPLAGVTERVEQYFALPNIRLHCAKCDRREAYRPFHQDGGKPRCELYVSRPESTLPKEVHYHPYYLQVLCFAYQCQGCLSQPEFFFVGRQGTKLTLVGRLPIETVEIDSSIPKSIRRYMGQAKIAFNSGAVLPALFLQRVLIEQFALTFARTTDLRGEELMDLYATFLPLDFKTRFPSLKTMYGELSSAIHSAREDDVLFEKIEQDITKHFQARRLFGLGDAAS